MDKNLTTEERNAAAVMQALMQQNEKLNEFQQRLVAFTTQMNMMQEQLTTMKMQHMKDLTSKFGSGPTS